MALRILWVEDSQRFIRATRGFWQGHAVTTVGTVAQALEQLGKTVYDALLVDFDLPDGKGTAVVAAATGLTPRPRIIAVSSHEFGNQRLLEAGADVICAKADFAHIADVLT